MTFGLSGLLDSVSPLARLSRRTFLSLNSSQIIEDIFFLLLFPMYMQVESHESLNQFWVWVFKRYEMIKYENISARASLTVSGRKEGSFLKLVNLGVK